MRSLLALLALSVGSSDALVLSALRRATVTTLDHHRGCSPLLQLQTAESGPAAEIRQTVEANRVVVYSKSWCPYCAQTKALFDELDVPYTAVELDELGGSGEALQLTLLELTKQRTVPNVFVGGVHVGGNDDTQRAARSGELARLLEQGAAPTGVVVRTAPAAAAAAPAAAAPAAAPPAASSDPLAAMFKVLFAPGKGRKIAWGVFQQEIDPASVPSDEERASRREAAEEMLVNIDGDERSRRLKAGLAMSAATVALAVGLLAGHAPLATRFAVAPPLFLAVGFLASAQQGL